MTETKKATGATEVKKAILVTDTEAQYDEKAKRILSNKIILAHILSQTVKDFVGMLPEEIVPLIEGEPYVGCVPIEPGLTNGRSSHKGERIIGFNTENLEVNEGLCIFDIIFYVRVRDGLRKIIINMEAQKEKPGSYHILNRGIFYNCRMVSSQKERDFHGEDFDDILPVHSIWIMMNQSRNWLTHVHLVQECVLDEVYQKGQMDAINIHMLGLGKELPEYDEEHKLHRLLGVIFSTTLSKEEKLAIMEQEYKITLEEDVGEDVRDMCSLSQYVKEEGIEIGMQRGIAIERERSEKLLAEKDEVIAEKDEAIAEKDEAIAEKDALITNLRRKLAFYL